MFSMRPTNRKRITFTSIFAANGSEKANDTIIFDRMSVNIDDG